MRRARWDRAKRLAPKKIALRRAVFDLVVVVGLLGCCWQALVGTPGLAADPSRTANWVDQVAADESTAPIDTEKIDRQGTANTKKTEGPAKPPELPMPKLPVPLGAKRLAPNNDSWLDAKHKQVILDGEICLRQGMLEMFACTRGSKEHESIVTLDTKAYLAHAALLALGAKTGGPAQFNPT